MSNKNGLLAPQATHGNPEVSYYLRAGQPIVNPTLVEPVAINSVDGESTAHIYVDGAAAGVYEGAMTLQPGLNAAAPTAPGNGITIRSAAGPSTVVEIGANAQGPNLLYIAGASGVGQVYDEVYNQPVALQPITLSATNPLCAPDPANVGEIFRCAQAGVAAAAAAIGTNFAVPKTGWYALQTEVKLGNAPAPAAPTINVPITVSAGVNLGEVLSFAITDGVVVEPYGLMEVSSNEMCVAEVLVANSIVVRTYTSLHLLEAGNTYTFSLRASSAVWNIGAAGQIKAELIAMC